MTIWIIEPRDPLIVRDGRPFGPDPGARAATLSFPFPSTIAGGLRGLAGRTKAQAFDTTLKQAVLERVHVRGPLLVALDNAGVPSWFAPAPSDASIHQTATYDKERGTLVRLVPATMPQDAGADMIDSLLAQAGDTDIHKVHPLAPQFWKWKHFEQWLLNTPPACAEVMQEGVQKLETTTRMHVKIKSETQTADEGFLYQTRGLEFATKDHKRLALAAHVVVEQGADVLFANFNGGMAPLGGERRLMRWEQQQIELPAAPHDLFAQIAKAHACRIILLTPGYFTDGYKPSVAALSPGLNPELVAAAVPRAQIVSGWDMAANAGQGAPKPTRRLTPAGSVYFIRFAESDDAQAIEAWARNLWMRCISEDQQSVRDGFGLAVLGVWNNETKQIGA